MNTDKIHYFLTTAHYLNISQASQQLYISQPALSRQLVSIEEEWKVKLFRKTTKKVELTPAGEMIYRELPKLLQEYNALIKAAQHISNPESGQFNIGFLDGHFIPQHMLNAINDLSEKYPNLEINIERLSFHNLSEKFNQKELDFVFTVDFAIDDMKNVNFLSYATSKTYMAISKRHVKGKKSSLPFVDLSGETILVIDPKEMPKATSLTTDACKRAGFSPKIKEVRTMGELQLLVEAGQGIGVVSDECVLAKNENIILKSYKELYDRQHIIVWHKEDQSLILKTLLEIIKKYKE